MAIIQFLFYLCISFKLGCVEGCEFKNKLPRRDVLAVNENTEIKAQASYIRIAKTAVKQYQLTDRAFECLFFDESIGIGGFAVVIDVREVHSEECGGDFETSPRLFSIAFDKENNIWSDAKSLLGQFELLESRK